MSKPILNLCEVIQRGPSPSGLYRLTRSKPGAFLVSITFLLVSPLGTMLIPPLICLLHYLGAVSHAFMRWLFDMCVGGWMALVAATFEYVFGVKTRIFGYRGQFKKRCVFIMNHVSHLDWIYLWALISKQGDFSKWKVVTKDNIRNIPFLGQCMQCVCLLFIKRDWNRDEAEFRNKLDYFNSLNYPCQILIFPEGGDLTYRSKMKSDTYADENKLPRYNYCLHPRTRGFTYIVSKLREQGLDAIYDITIGFPDTLPKTEADFVSGVIPRQIDFHVKSYEGSDVPAGEDNLAKWCQERWREKEALLHNYYNNGGFKQAHTKLSSCIDSKDEYTDLHTQPWSQSRAFYILWFVAVVDVLPVLLIYFWPGPMLVFYVLSIFFTVWLCMCSFGYDGLVLRLHKKATKKYLSMRSKNCSNGVS